jgi:nucleoside 2-deoxyribosyltransferase
MFDGYVEFIHQLAEALKSRGFSEVKYALVNSDPQLAEKPFGERARLCYLWDRELVQRADIVVAEATFPSTGLGIELQIAEACGIPVVLSFRKSTDTRVPRIEYANPDHSHHMLQIGEGYVSLMALGLPTIFKVVGYESEEEGVRKIVEAADLAKNETV